MQDMLFGLVEGEPTGDGPLVVAGLNVQGGSPKRARELLSWCSRVQASVLAFSEVLGKNAPGLVAELRASGYECCSPGGLGPDQRGTMIAARAAIRPVFEDESGDGRWLRVGISWQGGGLSITGVYAPTNGMSTDSSAVRRQWQSGFLGALARFPRPGLLIGDFNVLEPNPVPPNPYFEQHDYDFYSGIVGLGYVDEFRRTSPEEPVTSWSSPRFGAQRLDHAFASGLEHHTHTYYDASTVGVASDHSAVIVEISHADQEN